MRLNKLNNKCLQKQITLNVFVCLASLLSVYVQQISFEDSKIVFFFSSLLFVILRLFFVVIVVAVVVVVVVILHLMKRVNTTE